MVSGGENEHPEIYENEEIVIRATDPELVENDERKIPLTNSELFKVELQNTSDNSYLKLQRIVRHLKFS